MYLSLFSLPLVAPSFAQSPCSTIFPWRYLLLTGSHHTPVVSTILLPPLLSAIYRYMTLRESALTSVLPSPAQSAITHVPEVNTLSYVQVASPGCTKSAHDSQIPTFTTIYGSGPSHRHLPHLPLRGNIQTPYNSSPNGGTTFPSLTSSLTWKWAIHLTFSVSPPLTGRRLRPQHPLLHLNLPLTED